MTKFLITGATGHIGNVLAKELARQNFDITALVPTNENLESINGLNLKIQYGDIRNAELIDSLIDDQTVVFHLAGIININMDKHDLIYDVNVNGTKNIVDACVRNHAIKLIYTSSVHMIVPTPNAILTEPTIFDENVIEGDYAKTKTIATRYLLEACRDHGLNGVVVYPSGIIGPYDYKMSELGQVIVDYMNKKLLAYVKGGYNFVDVRDVVDGIINAYTHGISGQSYILSGEYLSLKELFNIINEKIGRKGFPSLLSIGFVRMFARMCENYYIKRGKKPVFTKYSLYTLTSNSNFSHDKATNELNYNPRNINDTISDTIDWFIANRPELIDFTKIKNYQPNSTNTKF